MLQFPDSVYTSTGSSEVLPLLLDAVDPEKLVTVPFLRGGRVYLTFKDPVSCDELMSSGLTCGDVEVRVVRADSRFRSVHVHDLPSEVSDEDVKSFFQSYGQVLSVRRSTFTNFPAIYNGNRVLEMALDRDIPYLISFGD